MGEPAHWNERYDSIGAQSVSWYEERPATSLDLLGALGVKPDQSVIDMGGGASMLVDHLLAAGHEDLTVLDLSAVALATGRDRIGDPPAVTWLEADLLRWRPARRWDVWHDRAVLHFLVDNADRSTYVEALRAALTPGGAFVIGTFAEDGPTPVLGATRPPPQPGGPRQPTGRRRDRRGAPARPPHPRRRRPTVQLDAGAALGVGIDVAVAHPSPGEQVVAQEHGGDRLGVAQLEMAQRAHREGDEPFEGPHAQPTDRGARG